MTERLHDGLEYLEENWNRMSKEQQDRLMAIVEAFQYVLGKSDVNEKEVANK